MRDLNPCKGCVCNDCLISEKNGAPYLCKSQRCKGCEVDESILKLGYCENAIPLDEGGDIFTL